jgi:hypothetical protein
LKLQQFIVKKAASLYDASLQEADNESQDKPPGEEGEFFYYRPTLLLEESVFECNLLLLSLFFNQNVDHILFDKLPCHLQELTPKFL